MQKNTKSTLHAIFALVCLISFRSAAVAQEETRFEMFPVSEEAFYTMIQFFQYDKEIPLGGRVVDKDEAPDFIREKIVFLGANDSRVPGYLTIPTTGTSPFPCVLQIHGQPGSKSGWWKDDPGKVTESLLSSGFALLALDAQYEGERVANNDYQSSIRFVERGWFHKLREMVVHSTVDYRRAIDYLATRPEIDTERIGVIGYSLGGMMTFLLTGVEPRVKVSVAAVTPLMGKTSPGNAPQFANYQLSAISPRNYGQAMNNRAFLMLMGNEDFYYTVDEARQVFDLIDSKTKDLIFYDCAHKLPTDHVEIAVKWFKEHL